MLFIHEPEEENWSWDDNLEAPVLRVLEELREEGVVGAVGLGSNRAPFPARLAETGRFDVVEIANGYTLLQQPITERLLPAARVHDHRHRRRRALLQRHAVRGAGRAPRRAEEKTPGSPAACSTHAPWS